MGQLLKNWQAQHQAEFQVSNDGKIGWSGKEKKASVAGTKPVISQPAAPLPPTLRRRVLLLKIGAVVILLLALVLLFG